MRISKNLNINNTYRSLNLNFWVEPKLYDLNEDNLTQKNFLVYADKVPFNLLSKLDQDKQSIYLKANEETNYKIPLNLMTTLGTNRKSYYVYSMEHLDKSIIKNMDLASAISNTIIETEPINRSTDLASFFFKLYNAKFVCNKVFLNFDDLDDEYLIINTFAYLHEILARWTMQVYIVVDTKERQDHLFSKLRNLKD